MDLVIKNSGDTPIYEQIYQQIASQIVKGDLEANFCLPPIRTIAVELGISVITIKNAWDMLERDGLIYTRAGKGCFVSEHTEVHLENKKYELASERLEKDLLYYKSLGLTLEELTDLIKKHYPQN